MVLQALYSLATDVLTFWLPTFYTFKYLMGKDKAKTPLILKFWCIISVYKLLSLLLAQMLNEHLFPIVNLLFLGVLNLPPYQITEKIYNATLGEIFNQNRQVFKDFEDKIVKLFNKNTETFANKMKDSTSQRIKGLVGDVLTATITNTSRKHESDSARANKAGSNNSDDETDKDKDD